MITTIILLSAALLIALYTIRVYKKEKFIYNLMIKEYKERSKSQRLKLRDEMAKVVKLKLENMELTEKLDEIQTNADEELADLIKNSYDAI